MNLYKILTYILPEKSLKILLKRIKRFSFYLNELLKLNSFPGTKRNEESSKNPQTPFHRKTNHCNRYYFHSAGVTELSMDKPESEEEEDHWKDASPITPTCSPTKHPPKPGQLDKPLKTIEVDVHDFKPTSPLDEKDVIIIDSSATPLSKKLAIKYNQEITTGVEKATPKVKLKREPVIELEEPCQKVPESAAQPSTSTERRADAERRRTLRRMDSQERLSTSRDALSKTDVAERGAKKKVFKRKEQDRRSSRRKIDEVEEPVSEVSRTEIDEPRRRKDTEGAVIRSREERKSLREQECIERVTEFLTKHSVLTYSEVIPVSEPETDVQAPGDYREQRITRPSSIIEAQEVQPETSKDELLIRTKSIRRPEEQVKTPSSIESEKQFSASIKVTVATPEKPAAGVEEIKPSVTSPEAEVPATKRRSSMRKKPRAFSRESSRESLLDDTKKEVRIQENVEEIFFEDTSEQIDGILPEVQLVKARIITAEEAAANRVDEAMKIEIHSPPEVAVVSDSVRVRTGRVPSPETVNMSHLQLISLAKSTSENALAESSEENKISERNIKTEILLDLSKVSEVGDEEEMVDGEKRDRRLNRTRSEGSKRPGFKVTKMKERDGFMIGTLAQPDQPELTILLEHAAIERRRNVDDDRDSLVDFGVEKIIRR